MHEVVSAFRRIIKVREEKNDKAADMLTKDKKLYEQGRVRVVYFRAAEVSKLRKTIDKLTDDGGVNNLELCTMPGFVEEVLKFLKRGGRTLGTRCRGPSK